MSDWLGALIGAVERTAWQLGKHKRPKRNPIQQIVLQAKQAGIHPLVALQGGFTGAPLYGSEGIPSGFSTGLGEAVGSFGDWMMENRENQLGELDFERRRQEDFAHDRELQRERMKPTAMDKYYEALTKQVQLETRNMELQHAAMGATTGHNSWPIPPVFYDVPGPSSSGTVRVVPSQPGLAQRLENDYGEGGDMMGIAVGAQDYQRAIERTTGTATQDAFIDSLMRKLLEVTHSGVPQQKFKGRIPIPKY